MTLNSILDLVQSIAIIVMAVTMIKHLEKFH
jgi:hypothetical protein